MIRDLSLAVGIASLSLSYVLFTYQQLFSPLAMAAILILPLISFIIFIYSNRMNWLYLASFAIVILLISLLSISYVHLMPTIYTNIAGIILLVSFAVLISILFIYITGRVYSKRSSIIYVLLLLVLASALAYTSMYGFSNIRWNGVDELAANYYSAYLALHGVNPYTSSMQPIYSSRNIYPTVLLNGTYEDFYAYPALSFIAYMPFVALGIGSHSFMFFIAVLIFLVMCASFIIYQ